MYAPGLDIELTLKLNLASHVERTCINFMGCYGAINALKIADHICKSNPRGLCISGLRGIMHAALSTDGDHG